MTNWVLLIEDNPDHVLLISDALATGAPDHRVRHARDAEAALKLLRGADGDLPAAIILDLKLPRVSGRQVLRFIRAERRWAHLPVIILTTSNSPAEAAACRRAGASAYLAKPAGIELLSRRGLAVAGAWPDTSSPSQDGLRPCQK